MHYGRKSQRDSGGVGAENTSNTTLVELEVRTLVSTGPEKGAR